MNKTKHIELQKITIKVMNEAFAPAARDCVKRAPVMQNLHSAVEKSLAIDLDIVNKKICQQCKYFKLEPRYAAYIKDVRI